jgi:hypothetical protein
LMLFQWLISASIYLNFALVAIVSLLVIVMNRDALDVENTFPEILRFPLIKRVLVK